MDIPRAEALLRYIACVLVSNKLPATKAHKVFFFFMNCILPLQSMANSLLCPTTLAIKTTDKNLPITTRAPCNTIQARYRFISDWSIPGPFNLTEIHVLYSVI